MEVFATKWRKLKAEINQMLDNIVNDRPPPPPEEGGITTRTCLYFMAASGLSCAAVRRLVLPQILKQFAKTKSLSPKKEYEWGSYTISMLHAIGLSLWGAWRMKDGVRLRPPGVSSRTLSALSLGYFFEDLWSSRQEWTTKWEFALHHFLSITVQAVSMWNIPFIRFSVLWALTEWSTIFLDLMWFAREISGESSSFFRYSAIGFFFSYFFWRIIWMPAVWIAVQIKYSKILEDFGTASKSAFNLVILLQLWWFVAIVKNLKKKLLTSGPKA